MTRARPACSRCSTSSSSRRSAASAPGRGCCGRHSASTVAPFSLLVPVFGIAAAWLSRSSEAPSATELVGAAVVLGGLALHRGVDSAPARREARAMRLSRRVASRRSLRRPDRPGGGPAAQNSSRSRTSERRRNATAVARTGAAIVEVDHGHVTVTASRSDLRSSGAPGSRCAPRPAPPTSRRPTRRTTTTRRWPPRSTGRRRRPPGHRHARHASAPRTRAGRCGRSRSATTSRTDEDEPEVLFTATSTPASTSRSRWRSTCCAS